MQETRGFDPTNGSTYSLREKEENAHDYRYFPEPDLPPVVITDQELEKIRAAMPTLPAQMEQQLQTQYGLPVYDATQLCQEQDTVHYFLELVEQQKAAPKVAANFLINKLLPWCTENNCAPADCPVPASGWAAFLATYRTKQSERFAGVSAFVSSHAPEPFQKR